MGDNIVMPSGGGTDKGIISEDVTESVMRKEIGNTNLRKEALGSTPAYLLDFISGNSAPHVLPYWVESLKHLVIADEEGGGSALEEINKARDAIGRERLYADTALYIRTRSGTELAGYVDSLQAYRLLKCYVINGLGGTVKVYKSADAKTQGFMEVSDMDVKGVRIRL